MSSFFKTPLLFLVFYCAYSSALAQADDLAIAEELVAYCTDNFNKKIGRGQCTDLIFAACSAVNRSLYNDTRNINYKKEDLKPGDIIHMEWKKNLQAKQHYMIVMEVVDGAKVKIAHQNFNNQLKVVYTKYDLEYEENIKKRKITIYRMVETY